MHASVCMHVRVIRESALATRRLPPHPQTFNAPPPPPCRVIVLEDNDVLHLSGGGYGIYNTTQQVRQSYQLAAINHTSFLV